MGVAERATYLGFRLGALAASVVPPRAASAIAATAARVALVTAPARRRMAERHQARAAGRPLGDDERRRAARSAFVSYGRYWLEMFRLPAEVRRGDLDRHFAIEGYEHLEAALAAGHGAIAVSPHLGGFEYGAAWMARRGHRLFAVVEPVEPPELFEWFARVRESIGIEVIPLGPDVTLRILRALRENRVACLLADRDLTGDGVEVEFFGERTTLPAGPAILALRTGAPILPVAVYFAGRRDHRAVIRPALPTAREGRLRDDVARITQDLARAFEELVRAAPDQWHLLQPNWPSDRGVESGT